MKTICLMGAMLVFCLADATGQAKPDPLTGLPVIPAAETIFAGKSYGFQPTHMPEGTVCKSKVQGDFYSLNGNVKGSNVKVNTAVAWYESHLSGFKKVQGYESGRSQTAFFNSDGTIVVIVTGDTGAPGQDTDTYAVAHEKYQPGISAKTIEGLTQGKIVCK